MKFTARVGETLHEIVVRREDAQYVVSLGGVEHVVDARKLEADFYSFLYEGKSYEVAVESVGSKYVVRHGANELVVELEDASRGGREDLYKRGALEEITSIMPGKVVRVLVAPGDRVEVGQGLVVVEAMKMENEIGSPRPGVVKEVAVAPGVTVESGAKLIVLE